MGTSDLFVDHCVLEPFPHSSPPKAIFYESAATAYYENYELDIKIDRILDLAAEEGFQDGMEGRTDHHLNVFILEHPVDGLQHLTARLASEHLNQGVAADVVRVLGQIKHARSHDDRVDIAERLLYSKSPLGRDAGAVALGDLADARSIPVLQQAVDTEQIPTLKADMQASLDELIKDTHVVRTQEARS